MKDINFINRGFYDKKRDDLLTLFPKLDNRELIKILDLSDNHFQTKTISVSKEARILLTDEKVLRSLYFKKNQGSREKREEDLLEVLEDNIYDVAYLGNFLLNNSNPLAIPY